MNLIVAMADEYDYSEGEYIVLEPTNQLSNVRFNNE